MNNDSLRGRATLGLGRWLAVVTMATIASAETSPPRPHIILMMGDDHGWEETGYHGHPHVKTPVLDEMAAQGLRLDRFHSGHPNCSPTRASFLTGRHPNRMGTFAPGWSCRPEEITIAHLLTNAGYRCGHFGKWHVGPVKAASPTSPGSMGFRTWLSHDNFFETDPVLSRDGGPPEKYRGESSAILVEEAIRFIDQSVAAGEPSLTVIWFGSPHEPYVGLPEDLALYDHLPRLDTTPARLTSVETGRPVTRPRGEVLRERYAEITAMDRAIGRLRRHLTERGLKRDSLVFYCGDNGTSAESALGGPHRGAKGSVYQGGTLVPGLIEWPARIDRPRTSNAVASTSDILPTLCSLLEIQPPDRPLDGVDLTPVIAGREFQRPEPLLVWIFEPARLLKSKPAPWIDPELQKGTTPLAKLMGGRATRDFTNYRMTEVTDDDLAGDRSLIDGRLELVVRRGRQGETRELYDLEADPGERVDIAKQRPEEVDRLSKILTTRQRSILRSLTGDDYAR